jgi:hypothetical protein
MKYLKVFRLSHLELNTKLVFRVERPWLSAAAPDLATQPSIASSLKNQVKTVGLLVNH